MRLFYWLLGLDAPGTITHVTDTQVYPTSYPPLLLVVAVVVIALVTAGLNFLPQNIMRKRVRLALTLLRLAGFALLLLVMFRTEVQMTLHRDVRPTVAVLTDVSGTMALKDAGASKRDAKAERASRLEAAREFAAGPLADLSRRANVIAYAFNWSLQPDRAEIQPGGVTHIVRAVKQLNEREQDLQAVILLTDGSDTGGDTGGLIAPLLASRGLPVFPVVFGDPNAKGTARVKITGTDNVVRLGDDLRLNATVSSGSDTESLATIRLFEKGRPDPLAVKEGVTVSSKPRTVTFVIKPKVVGEKLYKIVMEGVKDSIGAGGTVLAEQAVTVVDSKIRVLYLDIPRDERKLLGTWLERDPVVDLATLTLLPEGGWYGQGGLRHANAGDGLPNNEADMYKYDVIIIGDIPRSCFRDPDGSETKLQRVEEFVVRRGGGLVTLGGRSVYSAGNYQGSVLARILPFEIEGIRETQAKGKFKVTPTPTGMAHPIMRLAWGSDEENAGAWLDELPTIDGCNRFEKVRPGSSLLAVREMKEADKSFNLPVMAVQNVGKGKVLSLAFDTTWRWQLQRAKDAPEYYRCFWGNVLRFLAPDPRITPNEPQVMRHQSNVTVGQRITLSTRLVDSLYKPLRDARLLVNVTSPAGEQIQIVPRDGRQKPGLYEYDIDIDAPGTWKVQTVFNEKKVEQEITAGEGYEELDDPRAKPDAMARFAKATGGRAFRPDEAGDLLAALKTAPRRTAQTATIALWNLPLTMALLIAMVSIDCFIRKRRGMV